MDGLWWKMIWEENPLFSETPIYPKWRICILEPCLSRGPFIKTKTSMTLPMGETMVWWKTEFLHQLRYVNSPGFNIGIFDHAIYQLVWSPWFLPSRVTSRKGFLQKSHLADRTQEVQQHSKGMELLKAAWEATRELEWLVSTTLLVEPSREIFFHLGTSSLPKTYEKKQQPTESQMSKREHE